MLQALPSLPQKHPLTSRKFLVVIIAMISAGISAAYPSVAQSIGWIAGLAMVYVGGESLVDIARANIGQAIEYLPEPFRHVAEEIEGAVLGVDPAASEVAAPNPEILRTEAATQEDAAAIWRNAARSEDAASNFLLTLPEASIQRAVGSMAPGEPMSAVNVLAAYERLLNKPEAGSAAKQEAYYADMLLGLSEATIQLATEAVKAKGLPVTNFNIHRALTPSMRNAL